MILFPEYSFIQFNDSLDDCQCNLLFEVAEASELSFYIDYPISYNKVNFVLEPGAIALSGNSFVDVDGYMRTPSSVDSAIKIDKDKAYFYSGTILQNYTRQIYGAMYYFGYNNILYRSPGGLDKEGTYVRHLLTDIPDEAEYLAACSYGSDPVIETASEVDMDMYLCDITGHIITSIGIVDRGWITPDVELSDYIACGDCFRLMIIEAGIKYYSNPFKYNPSTNHPLIKFRSKNETYFPYDENHYMTVRLPIILLNKSPKTDSEEYIDANGRIRNPFKQRRFQYELNIDFMPDDFHDKMMVMLMQEEIFIDDIEVNETGDYEINYEDELKEKKRKLHKASTEVSTQDILLMRNY